MKNDDPEPPVVQNIPALGTVIFPTTGKENWSCLRLKIIPRSKEKTKEEASKHKYNSMESEFFSKGFSKPI